MHSNRASAKVPSGRRASRNPLFTSDASACRAGASARPPCRGASLDGLGRRLAALGGSDVDAISQPRMYYGCTRRTRKEDTCRRRCTRAPHGQHATGRRLRPPPACATASRPSAPPWLPCSVRARPGRRRLRRPDPARARGDHQPALAMLRALGRAGGPRAIQDRILVASWAGRPDEVTQTYAQLPAGAQPPADVRLAVRALRDLRRWPEALAQFRAGMRLSVPARLRRRHRHDAGGRRPARRGAGRGRAAGPRPPRDADAHLALAYVHARRNTPFEALYATDRARDLMPGAAYVERGMCSPCSARMAGAALTHATRRPELYTEAQMRRLQADALAEQVRLASMPTRNEADRFAIADRVLALRHADPGLVDTRRRDPRRCHPARIDRLRAARALPHARSRQRVRGAARRGRGRAALRVGRCRFRLSVPAPAEQAAAIYQQVAQAEESHDDDPVDRLGNQTGRYYSLAEAEDFDGASQVMDETREGYPAWVYVRASHAHPQRPAPAEHAGRRRARLQADDTPEAQARLEGMARNAPTTPRSRANWPRCIAPARCPPRSGR